MISVVLAVFVKRSSSKRQHEFRKLRNKKIYPIKLEIREELLENKWNEVNRRTYSVKTEKTQNSEFASNFFKFGTKRDRPSDYTKTLPEKYSKEGHLIKPTFK